MTEFLMTVMGATGVGKSTLVVRMVSNVFVEGYCACCWHKDVVVDDETCLLKILDTDVEAQFAAQRCDFLSICAGRGFLFCFSITSITSFEEIRNIWGIITQAIDREVPMVLVGTKCDLEGERAVSEMEALSLAESLGCPYFETSAKDAVNVEECFFELVREMRKRYPIRNAPPELSPVQTKKCILS
jgi:small GTP-binding protein